MAARLSLKIRIGQALNRFPRTKAFINRTLMHWSKWTFLRKTGKKEGYFDFHVIEVPPVRIKYALTSCPFHKWHEFRNEIIAYARKNGGKVYAPLLHPDLVDIPSSHTHTRFELIKANLPLKKGTLLDIGAHWGYFCHKFEDLGFTCYAAESSALALYFLEKLKRAENKKFHLIKQSILDYHEKTDYDVVLALNILHHFLKTKERYNLMIKLLKRLDVQVMYLGTHVYSEHTKQMKEVYGNYRPNEFY